MSDTGDFSTEEYHVDASNDEDTSEDYDFDREFKKMTLADAMRILIECGFIVLPERKREDSE